MITIIKSVSTYTKESFSKKCKKSMILEKNYEEGLLIPANTNSKIIAGIYLGGQEVQTYGESKVLMEKK